MDYLAGTKKTKCKLSFVLSGGDAPKIVENFAEVTTIAGIPVLPIYAILLHQLLTWSPPGGWEPSKGTGFIRMCLDAVGHVRLNEMSPLWQSARVLRGIRQHVLKMPSAERRWVALGVNPNISQSDGAFANADEHTLTHVENNESSEEEEEEFKAAAGPSIVQQPPRPVTLDPTTIGDEPPRAALALGSFGVAVIDDSDVRSPKPIEGSALRVEGNARPPRRTEGEPTPEEPKNTRVRCDNPVLDLVVRDVIHLLKELGFECAIFGSTACQLYGNTRMPGNLDVLVLPPASFAQDQEWIKQQIVNKRPNQFLKLKKGNASGATYHALFYKLARELQVPRPFNGPMHCEVDILLPGLMHLPYLTSPDIIWMDGLPVVPFLTLLLQKLQGWGDHLAGPEPHKFGKHPIDAQDIQGLLSLVPQLTLAVFRPWRERKLMSNEFQVASADRVALFCRTFPSTKPAWCVLGFQVE
ncbi:hypothetical protein H1R20_g12942, partial [Candolleomyces eurysporus]